MLNVTLTPQQHRLLALNAARVCGAPDKPTCGYTARLCAWVETHAYPDRAEAERAVEAVIAEAQNIKRLAKADILILDFESLREACRDRQLAEIAALGAGFWPRTVGRATVWADSPALSGKRFTVSFRGERWWGEVFAPDDALDD